MTEDWVLKRALVAWAGVFCACAVVIDPIHPPSPHCGDATCDRSETCASCPADCGDCQANNDAGVAPPDAGTPPPPDAGSPPDSGMLEPDGPLPRLKTAGNRIVTPAGADVLLRGVNVLESEWILNTSWETVGIPYVGQNWHANVIVRGFAADPVNSNSSSYLSMLDDHVSLTEKNHMYLIFAFRSYGIDGDQPDQPNSSATSALVKLATRYREKSHVMFALQVEPDSSESLSWSSLRPLWESMVDAIRAATSPYETIIFIPGTRTGVRTEDAINDPVKRTNVVYKSHPYNHPDEFGTDFLDAYQHGLPVFLGEFGPDLPWMTMSDVTAMLELADQNQLGWAAWIFDDSGPPVLLQHPRTSFIPSDPFGVAVKAKLGTTPPLPRQ
jgi:hypothetical protein